MVPQVEVATQSPDLMYSALAAVGIGALEIRSNTKHQRHRHRLAVFLFARTCG